MAQQSELSRARIVRIATVDAAADPIDGPPGVGTEPQFFMSPVTPTGLRTTGLALSCSAPGTNAAAAIAAGFSVSAWVLNPYGRSWFKGGTIDMGYRQMFSSFDLNACAVFLQIAAASVVTPGDVYFHFWEQ